MSRAQRDVLQPTISKQCTKCLEKKPVTSFSKRAASKDGLQYRCNSCIPSNTKEYRKKYWSTYQRSSPAKAKKETKAACNATYRARVREADNPNPNYTNVIFKRLRIYAEILEGDWHVDHIQPLSRGGSHSPENLQLIPAIENLRKSNNV